MFEIGLVEEFNAVLSLRGDFGLATRLHGHSYRVQVLVQGDHLNEDGVLYDIAWLRERLRPVLGGLHYQNLNDLEAFREVNPTVENVAKYIYEGLAGTVEGDMVDLKVTVWESPTAFASYWRG